MRKFIALKSMSIEKLHQPSLEEMTKAKEMITEEQVGKSEEREATFNAGYKERKIETSYGPGCRGKRDGLTYEERLEEVLKMEENKKWHEDLKRFRDEKNIIEIHANIETYGGPKKKGIYRGIINAYPKIDDLDRVYVMIGGIKFGIYLKDIEDIKFMENFEEIEL